MLVTITVALAAVAVLAAIVVVAVGGGGELSAEHPDHPPLALPGRRAVGGTDAALLRLPLGLWGYHKQITDEALERFAYELTERDTRIAVLEQALAEARQGGPAQTDPRALPRGRYDGPVTREDAIVTRTDRTGPRAAADPAARQASAWSEPGFAPLDDPWKTITDEPQDDRAEDAPEPAAGEWATARQDDERATARSTDDGRGLDHADDEWATAGNTDDGRAAERNDGGEWATARQDDERATARDSDDERATARDADDERAAERKDDGA
ncbi:hypothetical protein [Actinomadura sp. DC4]|uniref:hypothetical protein n=1 Tax=Actinomadura sp. DC4 TaxID=3055069 RepID=UPI0025AF52CE|nr:hypothetical protein [Actinomadura sp. DC4]MDN3352690.1 hypothetical protein [Actinomadura sp. DC4]